MSVMRARIRPPGAQQLYDRHRHAVSGEVFSPSLKGFHGSAFADQEINIRKDGQKCLARPPCNVLSGA